MASKQRMRLDHLAVWVSDMDETLNFLCNTMGLKQHPMIVDVADDEATTGGMKAVFVDGHGIWLELILPTTPGPGMEMLEDLGDGAIVEVNFEAVDGDYRDIIREMESKGVQMLNMDGTPLKNWGRIDEGVRGNEDSKETGQYIAYWPAEESRGTTIEVYEKVSTDETNLLIVRDEQWEKKSNGANGIRIDSVNILVENLEDTMNFYTETMELDRHPDVFDVAATGSDTGSYRTAFVKANAVDNRWIQLVEPTSAGALKDLLTQKGNGYAAEVTVEVDDLDAYVDEMSAKGVKMCSLSQQPLPTGQQSLSIDGYGDRYCYFPLEISRGFRVKMLQRGPESTSMLNARDA